MLENIEYLGFQYGIHFAQAVNRSKIVLGISAYNDIMNYTSNRTWNSMACGIPYLCHRYKGIDNFFQNNKNIVLFNDTHDVVRKASFLLTNKLFADNIAKNGKKIIQKNHTYDNRSKELIAIYKKWRDNR